MSYTKFSHVSVKILLFLNQHIYKSICKIAKIRNINYTKKYKFIIINQNMFTRTYTTSICLVYGFFFRFLVFFLSWQPFTISFRPIGSSMAERFPVKSFSRSDKWKRVFRILRPYFGYFSANDCYISNRYVWVTIVLFI